MAVSMFTATVTTPGTPQPLTSVVTPAFPVMSGVLAGPVFPKASVIMFQADPGNTATKGVYVGGRTLNTTTRAGIGFYLLPGASTVPISLAEGGVGLDEFWIDGDAGLLVKNLFVTVIG